MVVRALLYECGKISLLDEFVLTKTLKVLHWVVVDSTVGQKIEY